MSGGHSDGGCGCKSGSWDGSGLMCRDLIVGLLKVRLEEPNLILHCGNQTFHLGICLFLQDFLYSSSRGDHIFLRAAPQLLHFCGQGLL